MDTISDDARPFDDQTRTPAFAGYPLGRRAAAAGACPAPPPPSRARSSWSARELSLARPSARLVQLSSCAALVHPFARRRRESPLLSSAPRATRRWATEL